MPHKQFKISIIMLSLTITIILIVGALVFSILEGWSMIDSFYFVTMTATTVGYGDLTPTNNLSKIITIIYSLSIVPFVLYTFSIVAKFQINSVYHKINRIEKKQRAQKNEILDTEEKISVQKKIINKQTKKIKNQEEEIEKQTRVNKRQSKDIKEHEEELKEHNIELDVVEKVVGKVIKKKK